MVHNCAPPPRPTHTMNLDPQEPLAWLMAWYRSRCDGDWEHQNGIRIGTIDNPGWSLDVDLAETDHAACILPQKLIQRSDDDWVFFEMKESLFRARGGPENLSELIRIFADFIERKPK
jgi:hypothetical protein